LQDIRTFDEWIDEPRWSWYYTPLWRCHAVRVEIHELTSTSRLYQSGGSLMSTSQLRPDLIVYHIYFTPEEFVMWKLESNALNYDKTNIDQGYVYS